MPRPTVARRRARAVPSTVKCDNHIAEKRIAQVENIYINNSQPAARKDDHTECDAVIEDGSPNVSRWRRHTDGTGNQF